jgi:hypothetical protein
MLSAVISERHDPLLMLVPLHHAIVPISGYPKNNALHPLASGGAQLGDAIYAWLANLMAEKDIHTH